MNVTVPEDDSQALDVQDERVAEVGSFGDALRLIPPHAMPEVSRQVQGVVAAALNWFVVTAPDLCAAHCVGLVAPPVPDILLALPEVTAARTLRPGTFRRHVGQLRHAVEVCERPARDAYNALSFQDRIRVSGDIRQGQSPATINRELLGPLLDDFVYARAWLATHGTQAGYWSYRFVWRCLQVAAIDSDASRTALADTLTAHADNDFHNHFWEEAVTAQNGRVAEGRQ